MSQGLLYALQPQLVLHKKVMVQVGEWGPLTATHGQTQSGILSSARGLQAYAWLKTWIEIIGDEDPVGQKYKYVINYILPPELYEEYCKDIMAYRVGESEQVLSGRAFARVWAHFKRQERVRVRRKANTTTKCESKCPCTSPPFLSIEFLNNFMNPYSLRQPSGKSPGPHQDSG